MLIYILISVLKILILILVALAALSLLRRAMTFAALCKVRLDTEERATCERASVPPNQYAILASAAPLLTQLGFEAVCIWRRRALYAEALFPEVYAEQYWHPAQATLAWVTRADTQTGMRVAVAFQSTLTDGQVLLTINRARHMTLPLAPHVELVDACADNLAEQWGCHVKRLQALPAERAALRDLAAIPVIEAAENAAQREFWLASGFAVWRDSHLRLSMRGAWKFLWQYTVPAAALKAALKRPYTHPAPIPRSALVDDEINVSAGTLALSKENLPLPLKLILFASTFALGALELFATGNAHLWLLLVILLIHESGHWLAMRLLGYRNISVSFRSILGAASTGHKIDATPLQEAMVAIAGPALGLLVAGAALFIPGYALSPELQQLASNFVLFSLVFNLFNLLPLGNLDGAHIVHAAVLRRFPHARIIFKSIGMVIGLGITCALLGIGFVTGLVSAYLLNVVLVFGCFFLALVLRIPTDLAVARLIKEARSLAGAGADGPVSPQRTIAALSQALCHDRYHRAGKDRTAQRKKLASRALAVLLKPQPGVGSALVGSGLLIGTWVFTLFITGAVMLTPPPLWHNQTRTTIEGDADFRTRYAAEPDPEKQYDLLEQRKQQIMAGDPNEAAKQQIQWIKQQRQQLIPRLPKDHDEHLFPYAHTVFAGIDSSERPLTAADTQALAQVIDRITRHGKLTIKQLSRQRLFLLIQTVRTLVTRDNPAAIDAQMPILQALHDSHLETWKMSVPEAGAVTPLYARALYLTGKPERAEATMQQYVADRPDPTDKGASRGRSDSDAAAWLIYGWYLLDTGRAQQALELASCYPRTRKTAPDWLELQGWAALQQNQPEQALKLFEQAEAADNKRIPVIIKVSNFLLRLLEVPNHGAHYMMLDQYIALQQIDPSRAAALLSQKTDWGGVATIVFVSQKEPWGQTRRMRARDTLFALHKWPPLLVTQAAERARNNTSTD